MKKLIGILGSLVLVASTASGVISCGSKSNKKVPDITVPDDPAYGNSYNGKFNYQSGPKSVEGSNEDNDFLTSFNASIDSTYSAYNLKDNDATKPIFYGDRNSFIKTRDDNFTVSSWLNDEQEFQNVIVLKKNLALYSNMTLSLKDTSTGFSKDQLITGNAKFEKYVLTNGWNGSIKGTHAAKEVSDQRQYVPDAVWDSSIEGPFENIDESSDFNHQPTHKVYFDVWNVLCMFKTSKQTGVGKHSLTLSIDFDYDGKHQTIDKEVSASITNHIYEDQNQEALKEGDISNNFGFNAGTYPTRSQKFWQDGEYKGLPNYNVYVKSNESSWKEDISDFSAFEKYTDLSFENEFISNDALLDISERKQFLEFDVDKTGKDFKALFNVRSGGELLGTISVFSNVNGLAPTNEAYNSANARNMSVDINGDGNIDSKDWDINGDGKYTEDDYESNRTLNNGPDEIGPNVNYANFISRDPKELEHLSASWKPLSEAGGQLVRGNGFQEPTMNQLIQFSGRLQDSTYSKDSIPEIQQTEDQINSMPDSAFGSNPAEQKANKQKIINSMIEKFKPYSDDYEYHLGTGTDASLDGVEFWTSTAGHKWDWDFDFSGLDEYMRIAAKNNMNEVLINPIDKGSFSFWYLKGDNKIGPLRTISTPRMNFADGKLTAFGKLYVDTILTPMIEKLSKHLAAISEDKAYKTNNGVGSQVKIFLQFDEDDESFVNYVMDAVNKAATGEKIYSFLYLGWRSNISRSQSDDKNFWKYMNEDLLNKNFTQVSLNYDWTINAEKNLALDKFRDLVDKRKSLGLATSLYVAGYEYPGAYTASDLSSSFWNMFFTYREDTNGFMKWGYDFLMNDYFDSGVIDTNGANGGHIAGEKYLEYSGSGMNVHLSMRMVALIEAEHYVNKIRQIRASNNFSQEDKDLAEKALAQIGMADEDKYIYSNNDYKYNIDISSPSEYEVPKDNNYDVTVSNQVYGVTKTIDSI